MEDAYVFHQDVMKLALSSLELLQHNLEEKAKCQKTNREYSYTSYKMRDLIDELKELVFEQLDSLKQKNLKDTEAREAAEQQVSSMNGILQLNCNQFRTEKFTRPTVTDICRSESDLQRIDELKECRSLQCCRGLDDVSFQSTESNKENVICRIEGSVVCKNTPQFKPPIPRNSVIFGLDILDNEFYVASNNDIEVFDARADNLKFIRKFLVKGLVQVIDVKASVKNDCLYIMDGSNGQRNEIFVTDKNGKVLNKWPVENYGNLSITEEGTVVLSVNASAKIVEYSHDGHLIQEVCLSEARVQNLWHAIKLRGGNFVVSYNQKENQSIDASGTTNEELSEPNRAGISIVDSSGVILKELRNLELHDPMYLAVNKCGSILVADCGNGRVLLLNSDLQYQREIATHSDGVDAPTAICLCNSTGQLFVADNSSNFSRCWAFCVSETN